MYEIIENIKTLLDDEGFDQDLPESINDITDGLVVVVNENVEEVPPSANNIANFESESYLLTIELILGDITYQDTAGEIARKKQLDVHVRDIKTLLLSNEQMDVVGADLIEFNSGFKNYIYMDCSYISTASITFKIQSRYEIN